MELNPILDSLGYSQSPNFLRGKTLESDRDFGHVFRKAQADCGLQGAYVLNGAVYEKSRGSVPVVYVCTADSEEQAREIHRKVWNQNVVPFLLVVSRGWVRLYPGFQYERKLGSDLSAGALRVLDDFGKVASELGPICASAVDNGTVWGTLGAAVTPEKRVDWQLLDNLRDLDQWLDSDGVHDRRLAHSMIGKFVYLQYLRQRQILSDARLEEWGINPAGVFSHDAKLNAFVDLVRHVDEWLNGSVFPLPLSRIRDFGADRIRKIASVFQGAQPLLHGRSIIAEIFRRALQGQRRDELGHQRDESVQCEQVGRDVASVILAVGLALLGQHLLERIRLDADDLPEQAAPFKKQKLGFAGSSRLLRNQQGVKQFGNEFRTKF